MLGTIDLYSLALTPDNTMYFDSVEAQQEWFSQQPHLSIDNISFNGARAFQLGKNYIDVIFNYNYVHYKLNNRDIYAFIDSVTYNGDDVCSLNTSVDLTQTFLSELQTAIVKSNICNITENESYFNHYKPYTNKVNVDSYNVVNLEKLSYYDIRDEGQEYYFYGYILILIDKNIVSSGPLSGKNFTLIDNGYPTPYFCVAIPIHLQFHYGYYGANVLRSEFSAVSRRIVDGVITDVNVTTAKDILTVFEDFGAYIVDSAVSIIFDKLPISSKPYLYGDNYNTYMYFLQPANATLETINGHNYIFITNNYLDTRVNIDLSPYINNFSKALHRSPYMYIRIGTSTQSILINLLDFDNPDNNILTIDKFTSCIYPFTTTLKIYYGNKKYIDPNELFTLTTTDPVPFSVSKWQEYYANNKASVNDGLETQQRYDRKILENRQLQQQTEQAISVIGNTAENIASGDVSKIIGGGIRDTTNLFGSQVGREIEKTTQDIEFQKEKSLLEIKWNDIKSSPSLFSNVSSSITAKYYSTPEVISVDLYIARNIDDIANFHKQYGYAVNRMQSLPWNVIKKHTVFDYVSFNEVTLKMGIPQIYTTVLQKHLKSGIRFWYDYNTFLNFDIPNEEVNQ